jgi:two-component system, NtrC family, response regulator AtoC
MAEDMHTHVILVVEDNHDVQEFLREALSEEGYRPLVVENGEAALAALETVQPDVITLDLNMPGIGGVQLLQAIRQRDGFERVPVIVVSAEMRIADAVRELAQAVVAKPFNLDELTTIIHDLLPPRQA